MDLHACACINFTWKDTFVLFGKGFSLDLAFHFYLPSNLVGYDQILVVPAVTINVHMKPEHVTSIYVFKNIFLASF